MSDHTYNYVQCDGCGTEQRRLDQGFTTAQVAPEGWTQVDNRNRKKLWDLCSNCTFDFTQWLTSRAVRMTGGGT